MNFDFKGNAYDDGILRELLARQAGMAQRLHQERTRAIERELVKQIEIAEGRVPSNEEVAKHGFRAFYPDGKQEYQWRGNTVLIIHKLSHPEPGIPWRLQFEVPDRSAG